MASVEHLQPEGMSPNGGRYTHVVKVGPWVSIAGQTASDENGDVVGVGDPAAQVDQVMRNLRLAVESVGGTFDDIVKTTVYVVGEENSRRSAPRGLPTAPPSRPRARSSSSPASPARSSSWRLRRPPTSSKRGAPLRDAHVPPRTRRERVLRTGG